MPRQTIGMCHNAEAFRYCLADDHCALQPILSVFILVHIISEVTKSDTAQAR